MKLTIHLVLIPPPHTPDQHPAPHTVFHYTTGLKLRLIINSGAIQPTTAGVEPHEKPVAWCSTSLHWEPTASKVPIPGMPGQLITAQAQGGLARITIPAGCAPHGFEELPRVAGTSIPVCQGLLLAGFKPGSDPSTWRFTPEPVPTVFFREVEFYAFASDRWLAVDLAELACRN